MVKVEEIRALLGDEYSVEMQEVTKNNGVKITGYLIGQEGNNVKPVIYANESMNAEDIVRAYHAAMVQGVSDELFTKENILANVFPTLINRERNKKALKDIVHIPYADLEIVFRVRVTEILGSFGSYLLRNAHLEGLSLTIEEIREAATRNIQGKGVIDDVHDLLYKLGKISYESYEKLSKCPPMKIVTTRTHNYGAGAIFDSEIVRSLKQELGEGFLIIPSSVDELIAVPYSDEAGMQLAQMIKEVNSGFLEPIDILSDEAYIYTDRMEVLE